MMKKLRSLLWNITYDFILRLAQRKGLHYNMLRKWYINCSFWIRLDTKLRANIMTARIVRRIKELELLIVAEKTEAVYFYGPKKPREMPSIILDDVSIKTATSIKYLDVIIDNRWNFREHIFYVATKVGKVTRALNRLMPNLCRPGERKKALCLRYKYSKCMLYFNLI